MDTDLALHSILVLDVTMAPVAVQATQISIVLVACSQETSMFSADQTLGIHTALSGNRALTLTQTLAATSWPQT